MQNKNIQKDSVQYSKLKERLYKTKLGKETYNLIFKDVYNTNKTHVEEVKLEVNPFLEFQDKKIRSIKIQQLDVLGSSVYNPSSTGNRFERFVSHNIHVNTYERVIRNSMLLFDEGDLVNPDLIKDNERILRQSSSLLDARILPIPIPENVEMIDILVIVQDVWPIEPLGSFSSFNDFSVGLKNVNVLGSSHSSTTKVTWKGEDEIQNFRIRSLYSIPFYKRTFISRDFGLIWDKDLKHFYFKASKPFISVETKHAGAVEVGLHDTREYRRELDNLDSAYTFPVQYLYNDAWLGRSFKIGRDESKQNKRIVVATRHYSFDYLRRPQVSADSNKTYWNQSGLLTSFGFSDRNYKRDILIFGFGRTEDVPIGRMASLTVGQSFTEFGRVGYFGTRYSAGHYLPKNLGYAYFLFDLGTFLKDKKAFHGVFSTTFNYFTPLVALGEKKVRQFFNISFTQGFKRDELEFINLTDDSRIRGVRSDRLFGKKRLNMGFETVVFSPNSFLGFRSASFCFIDLGLISDTRNLLKGPLYQVYGIGIRLRNEHLTFNTIELRLAYYPNIPSLSSPFRFGVSGATPLQLRDFDISAPEIVPFR